MKSVNQLNTNTTETINLLSSTIESITLIGENLDLDIEIIFNLSLTGILSRYRLICKSVIEFSFYHTDKNSFYNVESYKLIISKDKCYISVDPSGEENVISVDDQNFISCKRMEGEFLPFGDSVSK